LDKSTVGQKEYRKIGKYDDTTIGKRFGSWNKGLTAAGLSIGNGIVGGLELHVDHIQPWSRGGPTVFENLQTLCNSCNLGKSDEVS